jgi:beta-glucosidase
MASEAAKMSAYTLAAAGVGINDGTGANQVEEIVHVRNTGQRKGRETVQVYLSKPESKVGRPARWLAGFAVVEAEPGQEATVPICARDISLRHWTPQGWLVEPGV